MKDPNFFIHRKIDYCDGVNKDIEAFEKQFEEYFKLE